ncbi:unnamed protein product [Choristocarpus tenellus]
MVIQPFGALLQVSVALHPLVGFACTSKPLLLCTLFQEKQQQLFHFFSCQFWPVLLLQRALVLSPVQQQCSSCGVFKCSNPRSSINIRIACPPHVCHPLLALTPAIQI